jgi:ribosomal protein S18 acetylase RimI-like enzyme
MLPNLNPPGSEPQLDLRTCVDEDREFLFQVYASTRQDELAQVNWNTTQKDQFLRFQFDAQDDHYRKYYPNAQYFVVLAGGQPAGRLYLNHGSSILAIVDIALLPEYRQRGIGARIMRSIQTEAARTGNVVRIHVERFNPALHLYERLGFRLLEDRGVYLYLEWAPAQGDHK